MLLVCLLIFVSSFLIVALMIQAKLCNLLAGEQLQQMTTKESQVRTMWRRIRNKLPLARIDNGFAQALAGIGMMLIAIYLAITREYFFWPPELSDLLNDERLDAVIFILGLLVLLIVLTGKYHTKFNALVLVVCGGVMFDLLCIQIMHANMTSAFRMGYGAIGDGLVFALILRAEYKN